MTVMETINSAENPDSRSDPTELLRAAKSRRPPRRVKLGLTLKNPLRSVALLAACLPLWAQAPVLFGGGQRAISLDFAKLNVVIAGVAGGKEVVFVGEPLNGSVVVFSRQAGHHTALRLTVEECVPHGCPKTGVDTVPG